MQTIDLKELHMTDYLKALREAMDKVERADASQKILQQALKNLRGLTSGLQSVTAQLEKHLSVKPVQKMTGASSLRKPRKTKRKLVRLTGEQKKERAEVAKLRVKAHALVLRKAKKKKVSPANVYAELTQKYGHKAKDAGKQELLDRIKYLSAK